jgi:hypothetical protein
VSVFKLLRVYPVFTMNPMRRELEMTLKSSLPFQSKNGLAKWEIKSKSQHNFFESSRNVQKR